MGGGVIQVFVIDSGGFGFDNLWGFVVSPRFYEERGWGFVSSRFFKEFVHGGGGGFVGVGMIVFSIGVRRLTGFSADT